jgi:protein-ribulosamine 3-kinase
MSPEQQDSLAGLIARAADEVFSPLAKVRRCSGGCIHHAVVVELASGSTWFVKFNREADEMFRQEALGLEELAAAGAIRIPKLLAHGPLDSAHHCLILEAIDSGQPRDDFWELFGRRFANLHRCTSASFGFKQDNFIGSSRQPNLQLGDWVEFFAQHRLEYQLKLVRQRSLGSLELYKRMDRLLSRLGKLLEGPMEPPALLHGDLWSGNYLVDDRGEPVIFDPAVYYGAREADLAMPLLFGGFPESFFRGYEESWPLPAGWRERVAIYQLYHLLNHLNLFGSGYLDSCLEIARRFG